MKVLLIRFSSFGDVVQTLSVVGALRRHFPQAEIHWVIREDLAALAKSHPSEVRVWSLARHAGWRGLWRLARQLRQENFTHIYDAHNSLRARVLGWVIAGPMAWRRLLGLKFLRRPIYRWRRFLLFRFRINRFLMPFNGQRDLLKPLTKWGVSENAPAVPQLRVDTAAAASAATKLGDFFKDSWVALAPSAAYPLKRWPLNHWRELMRLNPQQKFVLLGGAEDHFLSDLAQEFAPRVFNGAGVFSYLESAAVVARSSALVSNDTGVMHLAEQLGVPCVALMGPAPFGFPSRPKTKVLELNLPCRPCSKHGQGPCVNQVYQRCLVEISPAQVNRELHLLSPTSENETC